MQGPPLHQGAAPPTAWVWLVSGIAEGPLLARALLQRGWGVRVSVVGQAATRAYAPHPHLELLVGDLADDTAVEQQLTAAPPRWLVDATHPFAAAITARLERVCRRRGQPLLRLDRQLEAASTGQVLPLRQLEALADLDLSGERLLLAIGSRHLPVALAHSNAAAHFARVLDQPGSLQLALAAGLTDAQLACLRPDPLGKGTLEQALCRRWQITSVLCRRSGGRSERIWRQVCDALGLRLLLLESPAGAGTPGLPVEALLEKLGYPDSPPAAAPSP